MDLIVVGGDVVVQVVQARFNHVGQVLGSLVVLNGLQCQVDA